MKTNLVELREIGYSDYEAKKIMSRLRNRKSGETKLKRFGDRFKFVLEVDLHSAIEYEKQKREIGNRYAHHHKRFISDVEKLIVEIEDFRKKENK